MEDLDVVNHISKLSDWLVKNQTLLLSYTVNIVSAVIILLIGLTVARILGSTVNKIMISRGVDATVADFISALMRYAIVTFTLIASLSRIGVETASVIAVLGAAGLAVGLSLQGSLSNLAAGVLLVTFRPFRTGETVDIGVTGVVTSVQIFSTTLKTADGKIVVVPNGKILSGNIVNFSREPVRRNDFVISVSYEADIDQVMKLLGEVVNAEERVLHNMGIQIGLNELASSSVNFVVRCWSKSSDLQQTYWDMMANFKRTLDANKIAIPYPQMDVHLHQQ